MRAESCTSEPCNSEPCTSEPCKSDPCQPSSGAADSTAPASAPGPEGLGGLSLADFERAGLVVMLRSRRLGETVVLASDDAVLSQQEDRVVYRASELERVLRLGSEELRRVHRLKRAGRAGGLALTVDSIEPVASLR